MSGSIKLNPGNPLGKTHLKFCGFNYFSQSGERLFLMKETDYIDVFAVRNHMINIGKSPRSVNLTPAILQSLVNGEDTYRQMYINEVYALAGDYRQGILCQYTAGSADSSRLYIAFVGDNNGQMDLWMVNMAVQYPLTAGGITIDVPGHAYVVDEGMVAGVEHNRKGVYTSPWGVENYYGSQLEGEYIIEAETDVNSSNVMIYTGDRLWATDTPPYIRKTPNIAHWTGTLIDGRGWWFDLIAGSPLAYEPDSQDDSGPSGPGGGDGEHQTSVDIPYPDLPPDITTASGIIKMFNPTVAQMNAFVNFIYSAPSDVITNFKKIWANPMDSIIQLSVAPFKVASAGADDIKFCGVASGVTAPVISNRYQMVDCGTKRLPEEYKTLLDYSDYTKVRIYLPFIGIRDLNPDDVIGAEVGVRYHVDLLTGECVAFIKPDKNVRVNSEVDIDYNSPLYTFNGNILSNAPLTGNNWGETYKAVMGIITAAVNPTPASVAGVGQQILGQKVTVQRTGNIVGSGGMLGDYTPYFIIERPIRSKPDQAQKYIGYPSNITAELSTVRGYTEVEQGSFRTDNFIHRINDDEAKELVEMVENGIILPLSTQNRGG